MRNLSAWCVAAAILVIAGCGGGGSNSGGGGGGTDQDNADGVGMAGGERDHLRPDAGFFDTDRGYGVGIGLIFVDFVYDGPWGWRAKRERDLYAHGHDRLQHGGGFCRSRGEQGNADGVGMAGGQRYYLRTDSGIVRT